MVCTNCGKKSENGEGQFCPFCGSKYEKQIIENEKKVQPGIPKVFCMNCGKKSINEEDEICPFCGVKYGDIDSKNDNQARKVKEIFTKKQLIILGIVISIVVLIVIGFCVYNAKKDKIVSEDQEIISENAQVETVQNENIEMQDDNEALEEPLNVNERTVGGPVLQEDIDFILDREVFGYIDSYPTLYSSNYPTILELYHRGDKLGKIFNDKNFEIKEDTWKYTSVEEGNYAIKFKARDWQYGEAWEVDFNYVTKLDGDKYPSISYATNMKDGADSMYFCIDSYTGDFGNIEYAYRACDAEASAMLYIAYGGNAEIQNILDSYSDYIIPDSSTRLLSESELYGLDQDTLKLARNEIYARHGYIFKSDELMNYFSSKSWYVPQYESDQDVYAQLNDIEKQNLDMIKSMEQ